MTIGVTWILHSKDNKFLLVKRDNNPDIPYPDKWTFPGGTVEGEETPEEAMVRELEEELSYSPTEVTKILTLYHKHNNSEEHFYYIPLDADTRELDLKEGQKMKLFKLIEIKDLDLGWWSREILPILKRYLEVNKLDRSMTS